MAKCTGKPTSTIFEEVTTVTALPLETITVLTEQANLVVTIATATSVNCPIETGRADDDNSETIGKGDSSQSSSKSDEEGFLDLLLGGGDRQKRGRRLRRQFDDCTTQTLYSTLTTSGDSREKTRTLTITVDSTITTSTPVSTLYGDCTESESSSKEHEESSSKSSSTKSSTSARISSTLTQSQLIASSGDEGDDSELSASDPGSSSVETEDSAASSSRKHFSRSTDVSTSMFTSTNSDGDVTSGIRTINVVASASSSSTSEHEADIGVGTYIGAGIGGVVGLLMLLVLARFMYRWCNNSPDDDIGEHAIDDWAALASHHTEVDSPVAHLPNASPQSQGSFEGSYDNSSSMRRTGSNTSSLERDMSMSPMQERAPLPTAPDRVYSGPHPYVHPSLPPQQPPPLHPPSVATDQATVGASSASRYSQAMLDSNAAGLGTSALRVTQDHQAPPLLPPMIKTTPPTEYQGSSRGSTVLLPRRSQLFDNTARAPEMALASEMPTYSYKDEHETLDEGSGTPRNLVDSNRGSLHIANPGDKRDEW